MTREGPLAVRCDLGVDQQTYVDQPASCDGAWGTSFALGQTGPGFLICVTDTGQSPNGYETLSYGETAMLDGITCSSETTGVTCTNLEGGGFEVRRAAQRIF